MYAMLNIYNVRTSDVKTLKAHNVSSLAKLLSDNVGTELILTETVRIIKNKTYEFQSGVSTTENKLFTITRIIT